MEASQPVLHWIRSCFDPVRNPCFREIYVPPERPAHTAGAAEAQLPTRGNDNVAVTRRVSARRTASLT